MRLHDEDFKQHAANEIYRAFVCRWRKRKGGETRSPPPGSNA
jgi:hypothetical protein